MGEKLRFIFDKIFNLGFRDSNWSRENSPDDSFFTVGGRQGTVITVKIFGVVGQNITQNDGTGKKGLLLFHFNFSQLTHDVAKNWVALSFQLKRTEKYIFLLVELAYETILRILLVYAQSELLLQKIITNFN